MLKMDESQGVANQISSVTLTCELVSETTSEKIDCSLKKTKASRCEISYQPTSRGRHQLHIKMEGEPIKGSPFPVTVIRKLGTPIKTISGVMGPWGVAFNQKGDAIIAESGGQCVSIFSPTGEKLLSFGSHGSGDGQFDDPRGVAVDGDGNILVVDSNNHRIQKFTADGKFITVVGKEGNKPLEFNRPLDIGIHPLNNRVYIIDNRNSRVQILNPDLTFSGSFGHLGSDSGQLQGPWDVAFDSTGNVYIADFPTDRIQVFTADGEYLRSLGNKDDGRPLLSYPSSICIDSDDVVYVTECGHHHRVSVLTCEGTFLTSFGCGGSEPGQFETPCGIVVDKNGAVYVSDSSNNRLQCF